MLTTTIKKLLYCSVMSGIIVYTVSCQDQRKAKNYNDKTQADLGAINFIRGGIEGGLTEIKAAKIAKEQSSNPRIIQFADMMIADHIRLATELKKIERDKMIDDRDSINAEHQKMLSDLSEKTGDEFDKAYIQMMIADHESAIGLFTDAGHNTSNTIQKAAEKALPKLRMHLDSAKAINSSLK